MTKSNAIGGFIGGNRHSTNADEQNLLKMKLLSVCDSLFGNKFAPHYGIGVDFASSSQRSESSFDVAQPSKTLACCRDETETDESHHLSPVSATTTSYSSPVVDASMSSFSAITVSEVEEKVVRFGDDDTAFVVHEIDHHRREEKKLIWYRNKELKRIRKEGQETLQLLLDGELDIGTDDDDDDDEQHCIIGLESFSDMSHPYAKQRSLHKQLLYDIVMDEQKRQYEEGIYFDDEALATKVRSFTSRCQHASFVSKLRKDSLKTNLSIRKKQSQTRSIADVDDQFIDESFHQQLKHYNSSSP